MKYSTYLHYYILPILGVFFLSLHSFIYSELKDHQSIDQETSINQPTDEKIEIHQSQASEEDEQLALDDEKLMEEIFNIIASSYKEIIDLSGLYFCGLLVDWDKLYEQIITLASKDLFKILKLFSWYIPAVLKNPKVSKLAKIKKSAYVACSLIVFWYTYKEFFRAEIVHKGLKISDDDALMSHRKLPILNL